MRIILASGSPRRSELLTTLGLDFSVIAPEIDESRFPDEGPEHYVERLAVSKAEAVSVDASIAVGADTAVVHRGIVLGKPAHPVEAMSMLGRLSGESHTVFTGLAVIRRSPSGDCEIHTGIARTVVRMLDLTDQEIAGYVATGEPMDKAGAYGLQGLGGLFVESVAGSPSNVIGLPIHLLGRLLRSVGVDPLAR